MQEVAELSDLQQVMNKMEEFEERLDQIEERQLKIMGGRQPENKLKVTTEQGGPTNVTAKVMKEVKNRSKENPVDKHDVKGILEEFGFDRSDKPVLEYMEKIARRFSNKYHFRSGKGSRAAQLWLEANRK